MSVGHTAYELFDFVVLKKQKVENKKLTSSLTVSSGIYAICPLNHTINRAHASTGWNVQNVIGETAEV